MIVYSLDFLHNPIFCPWARRSLSERRTLQIVNEERMKTATKHKGKRCRLCELDLRGLFCPIPVIKSHKVAKSLSTGDELFIRCDDPTTLSDIPAWAQLNRHEMIAIEQVENEICFKIKIGEKQ